MKWGDFERETPILKILPVSWSKTILTTGPRYCGSLWVKGLQNYKLSKLKVWKKICSWLESNNSRVAQVQVLDDLIILKVWQTVTLRPFNLQRPTVPLWREQDFVVIILSTQETGSFLNIDLAVSKWPHFNTAYVVSVCIFFAVAV